MSALINWTTTGEIAGQSLLAGIVIVGAFSVGARLVGTNTQTGTSRTAVYAAATLCFLVAAVAVAFGIYYTVKK